MPPFVCVTCSSTRCGPWNVSDLRHVHEEEPGSCQAWQCHSDHEQHCQFDVWYSHLLHCVLCPEAAGPEPGPGSRHTADQRTRQHWADIHLVGTLYIIKLCMGLSSADLIPLSTQDAIALLQHRWWTRSGSCLLSLLDFGRTQLSHCTHGTTNSCTHRSQL